MHSQVGFQKLMTLSRNIIINRSSLLHSQLVQYILMPKKYAERRGSEKNRERDPAGEKKEKSTAPGIPRRSPIQVLTGPDVA